MLRLTLYLACAGLALAPSLAAAQESLSQSPAREAAPQQTSAPDAAQDFRTLREEMWQSLLDNAPLLATSIGDRRGDGMLDDLSQAAYDRRVEEAGQFLARLAAIDPAALPADLRVDHAILKRSLQDRISAARHDHDRYVLFTNRGGWFLSIAALPERSPFFTLADYESYVGRLENFARMNEDGIARSREAVLRGLTQPCGPMAGLEARVQTLIKDDPRASVFWKPFARRPETIAPRAWDDLEARAAAAITGGVFPALQDFISFYTEDYAPRCRTGLPGISETPGGADYYTHRAQQYTTTDLTPDEIHELGRAEVARIRAEMEEVAAGAGFASREEFITHLRTDPQYYLTDAQAYLDHAAALAKYIDGWMPRLFGRLPRQPYTVLPIPEAQAPGNTTAYYERGSLAAGQPGIYRVNTTELDQRPLWELPALGVHEAVPGHHQQIALQQELEIHPLRANGTFFTAFTEGWGLYSERLGIEMGLYDTPAKEMGRLSYEMWRAARLVVDTGIHSKGWSKQEAVDFMLMNTALSPANIDAEVNRYITWPGQALAYKIGELKIRELRMIAEETLGTRFDLRAFHDAVLENGAVPLDVLEEHIESWIEAQVAG
ncbi:MAG: DUF885 domain-containing protein [Erythrobacter sp.]